MKSIFDTISFNTSKEITAVYSTSFSSAVKMLAPSIRQDIYNIYGFVRLADEIVDSFHNYNQKELLDCFEADLQHAIHHKISLNPILNAFQNTVHKHEIPLDLMAAFLNSMRLDLEKKVYHSKREYAEYIYGSADVVGLMCLKVFVKGDAEQYEKLKAAAMRLGSAFQKVNFLRDLKADFEDLERSYFPNINLNNLDESSKEKIIAEIEEDFEAGFEGIKKLPNEAKFGVYTAFVFYKKLVSKLMKTPAIEIKTTRIRVSNYQKLELLIKSYLYFKMGLIK